MKFRSISCHFWLAVFITFVMSSKLAPRQTCSSGYTLCSPPGATGTDPYDHGDGLLHLYSDLIDTVNLQNGPAGAYPAAVDSDGPAKRQSEIIMCCAIGMDCLLLVNIDIPMCYDKFTTDFSLPNGDFGTVSNGTFLTVSGGWIDLISGTFYLHGTGTGNIYLDAPALKPNTATMAIPTPYTSSGVGSAIPASELGSSASYSTSTAVSITAGTASSSPILSLSGPAVTPCSTCCMECGRPSTTINTTLNTAINTMPTITTMPTATPVPSTSGSSNATATPPITVGTARQIKMASVAYVAILNTLLFLLTT